MQGLWTNHRRSRINLNSTSPAVASSPTPPDNTSTALNTLQPVASSSQNAISPSLVDMEQAPVPTLPDDPVTANGKRKTRINGKEESNKRLKSSIASTSTKNPKDYSPPDVRLSDLGGVQPCVEKMLELVAMPLCHPEIYLHTGVQPPRGVLLHGPPGCGKTLLANAIAGVSDF
jgi:ribosome biogenesis ATPase